jgi:hypothetical protein
MSLTTGLVLFFLLGLPALAIAAVVRRMKAKLAMRQAFYWKVQGAIQAAGWAPLGEGLYRREDVGLAPANGLKMEIFTNPLFSRDLTLRLAAYSDTIHEFELRRGKPVPPDFADYAPLLERWESCGKMFTECWAARVTSDPAVTEDVRALAALAHRPLSRIHRGGTFTLREGFEKDVPQRDWRHDERPLLPPGLRRWCVSYWQDGPLFNPPLARFLFRLAEKPWRLFFITDTEDLRFLEMSMGRRGFAPWGALVELMTPEHLVAADLHTDGGFFGGVLCAKEVPEGFESEQMPRIEFHRAALKVFRKGLFYARRLWDWEGSWYSGELEILSPYPLDVRQALFATAAETGAQVMEIQQRFHKRLVKPLED